MIPNPGSDEARKLGCRCPVLDNNHGRTPPWPPDGWWIDEKCLIHASQPSLTQDSLFETSEVVS